MTPPQVLCGGGLAFWRPPPMMSLKPTRVSGALGFGLLIVKVSDVVAPMEIEDAPNDLLIEGGTGGFTVMKAVA